VDWTILNAVIITCATVGGLFGLAILARRFTRTRSSGENIPLRILSRQPLTQKASLFIVDIGDKRLVLGVTEHTVTVLATLANGSPSATVRSAPLQGQPLEPLPTSPHGELSFRAYLASMFQRSNK
jgi:flagellar biosynthetic protein FliO